jgi:gluconate 2-dehydrogenase gamma chain
MEALTERIIPRTDTPGAKDAGVALLIDKAVVADASLMQPFRAGLADLNAASVNSYGQEFVELTEQQQIAVLTPMSLQPDSSLGKFFAMAKDMTVDAYYKTEIGLKTELGWHGNTYLASFPGCQHPEHHNPEHQS